MRTLIAAWLPASPAAIACEPSRDDLRTPVEAACDEAGIGDCVVGTATAITTDD